MSGVFTTATRLRVAVALVVLFVSAIRGDGVSVLPWILLVVALDLVSGFFLVYADVLMPRRSLDAARVATAGGAFVAGLSLVAGDSCLPLFVIPAFRSGEKDGRRGVLISGVALLLGATAARLSGQRALPFGSVALWAGLAVALGILAAWEDRLALAPDRTDPMTNEAAVLVARLAEVAASLEGGLDPALLAEGCLDALSTRPGLRAAVLAGPAEGQPIPLALQGATRVPWPQPQPGATDPLALAWAGGEVGTGHEDRRAVVAVPLRGTSHEQVGVLVCDWPSPGPAAQEEVADIVATADRHAPSLAVALAYHALRDQAGVEERRALARSMHDGVAQDVAALGFQMDLVRYAAQEAGDSIGPELVALRAEVARILGDLRSDITDLRIGLRPEHGLGAAVSTRLQQFGAATGAVVRIALQETGFRLPAATEVRLYRLLLDVLAEAQRHQARSVDVELTVSAPNFALEIRCDTPISPRLDRLQERLGDEGTVHLSSPPEASGSTLVLARSLAGPLTPQVPTPTAGSGARLEVAS